MSKKETTNFTLRIPVEQKFALEKIAHCQERTLTNLINLALKKYIEEWEMAKKEGCRN
jgi:predicted DNA-binding protein